jgi:hypothetical protein
VITSGVRAVRRSGEQPECGEEKSEVAACHASMVSRNPASLAAAKRFRSLC